MPKRVIGIDLDDVLLDFNTVLCVFHNLKYGTSYTRDDIFSFDLENIWGCTREESTRRVVNFYQSGWHKNAPPVPGAVEAIKKLKKNNELVIISAKPDYLEDMTREWVEKHFPKSFKSINFTNHFHGDGPKSTKLEMCDRLGAKIFIDDHLDFAKEVISPERQVILLDTPWNRGSLPEGVIRVKSWQEIVEMYK